MKSARNDGDRPPEGFGRNKRACAAGRRLKDDRYLRRCLNAWPARAGNQKPMPRESGPERIAPAQPVLAHDAGGAFSNSAFGMAATEAATWSMAACGRGAGLDGQAAGGARDLDSKGPCAGGC